MIKNSCCQPLKYEWLEAMRGIAAIWVILYHSRNLSSVFLTSIGSVPLISNGWLGVDFFFVLSGFIIALSSNRLIGNGQGLSSYLKSRLIRIYVPYFPVSIAMIIFYIFFPDIAGDRRGIGLISSLFLLPTDHAPALNVAWSLMHEVVFYGIFSIIFISRILLFLALSFWAIAIFVNFLLDAELGIFYSYFLNPMNLCFLLGVIVFYARPWNMSTLLAKILLPVGFIIVLFSVSQHDPDRLVVSIGFSFIIASATSAYWSKLKPFCFFGILGAASYCIYLIHNPLLSIFVRLLRFAQFDVNPWVTLLLTTVLAATAGLAYWHFYETYALKIAYRFLKVSGKLENSRSPVP